MGGVVSGIAKIAGEIGGLVSDAVEAVNSVEGLGNVEGIGLQALTKTMGDADHIASAANASLAAEGKAALSGKAGAVVGQAQSQMASLQHMASSAESASTPTAPKIAGAIEQLPKALG